jgi:BRO family, N-terminal domain
MDDEPLSDMALAVFEEQADATIRRAEINGVWYFSVVDVVSVLTDSTAPRQYWMDTKKRMRVSDSWKETSENLLQLPLLAADGKPRLTDCANTETLLRIIQSIPSPKAEPIKQWLAKVGADNLEAERRPVRMPAPPSASPIAAAWVTSRPADDDLLGWAEFLERMALVYRQQASLEARVRYVETASRGHESRLDAVELRLDAVEQSQKQVPELLDLLRPEQLSPLHQTMLSRWVNDLAHLTGWHITMIYQDLVADFAYHSFSDAGESDWQRIADWFQARLEAARKRR